jgi:RimJ/RimL family protein N-acetyltransferase
MVITKDFKIITERLLLVPINILYQADIFQEFTEDVARYLVPQPTGDIDDTISFINDSLEKTLGGQELQLVALDKKTKEFLGCLGLHEINTKKPELGLWFKKSVWGLGYGKESMLALKNWAEANLEYENIIYPVFKDNLPSRKIAEFLGGKIIKEFIGKNFKGEESEEIEYLIEKKSKAI